jgi:Methyltransferase domain
VTSASTPVIEWLGDDEVRVDGTTFGAKPLEHFPSTADNFCVAKEIDVLGRYAEMLERLQPRSILELGIFSGGSTAFLAAVARPEKLVAIELEPPRSPALQDFIDKNGFADTVRPYYGVDQADRAGITQILDREIGTAPLDLVIDDASHQLDLTRQSFDFLFPRVRPGGLYVIEDWGYTHVFEEFGWALEADAGQPHDETPLTALVFELTMAAASRRGLITDVTVNRDWAMVRRGPAELDDCFAISAWYGDRGRRLVNGLPPAPAKSG